MTILGMAAPSEIVLKALKSVPGIGLRTSLISYNKSKTPRSVPGIGISIFSDFMWI